LIYICSTEIHKYSWRRYEEIFSSSKYWGSAELKKIGTRLVVFSRHIIKRDYFRVIVVICLDHFFFIPEILQKKVLSVFFFDEESLFWLIVCLCGNIFS